MNKDILLSIVIVPPVLVILIFLNRIGYKNIVDTLVYVGMPLFILIYTILRREKIRAREKHKKLAAVIFSSFWPGLGQAIFAKQWKKMFFTLIVFGGFLISIFLLTSGLIFGKVYFIIGFIILLFTIGFHIYNMIDAYKVSKQEIQ